MAPPSLGRGPPGSESQPTGPPQLAPGRTSRLSVREHGDALRGTGASRLSASSRYPTLRSRRAGRYPPEPGGEDRSQRSEGCGLRGAEVEPALPAAHPPRLRRRQIPGRAAGGKTPTPEQESE